MAKKPTAPDFPKVSAKLPKSMGACADLLYDVKQARLAAEKYAAEIKAEETRITNYIIDNLDKRVETGAAGRRYRAQVKTTDTYRVDPEKWPKFYDWVGKNKRFDILQKRLSEDAIKEVMASLPKSKQPPGVLPHTIVKVSLTKVG